ncbi:hypothetical protein [Streptomyces sp. NPDC088801]|uniref:hypothetical protein n=1 Tax=Streptomyces sp. NPDC088801 TaxID=3365903 RepID=UPI003815FEFD
MAGQDLDEAGGVGEPVVGLIAAALSGFGGDGRPPGAAPRLRPDEAEKTAVSA